MKTAKTISQAFAEFLDEQKARISHKTFLKYQSIIQLYGMYLENYWPGHDGQYDAIKKQGGTYCGTFGCPFPRSDCIFGCDFAELASERGMDITSRIWRKGHRGGRGCS